MLASWWVRKRNNAVQHVAVAVMHVLLPSLGIWLDAGSLAGGGTGWCGLFDEGKRQRAKVKDTRQM